MARHYFFDEVEKKTVAQTTVFFEIMRFYYDGAHDYGVVYPLF